MRHVVAAAIVLLLAAGCGNSRPSAPRATKLSPVSRIQRACLQRNDELRELSRPRNPAEFAGYVASLLNIVRYYRGQLAAVRPGSGRQDFVRYRRRLAAHLRSAPD